MNTQEALKILKTRLGDPEIGDAINWIINKFTGTNEKICQKCGLICTDYYTLDDRLWWSLTQSTRGFLHLSCVEQLLGRKLIVTDFKLFPINSAIIYLLSRR